MGFDITSMLGMSPTGGVQANTIMNAPLDSLIPYHNHKFKLYEGERLEDMVQSIKTNGVLNPIIARPASEIGKYEILAGHNRCNAARLAGLTVVPCIVKNGLTDEEAEVYVVETNLMQRGFNDLSISEQATVIAYQHSKMFTDEKAEAIRTTYTLNTNTKKFHYPFCSGVEQMKEKNKKEFCGDREDVISQGYSPCKRCNP